MVVIFIRTKLNNGKIRKTNIDIDVNVRFVTMGDSEERKKKKKSKDKEKERIFRNVDKTVTNAMKQVRMLRIIAYDEKKPKDCPSLPSHRAGIKINKCPVAHGS